MLFGAIVENWDPHGLTFTGQGGFYAGFVEFRAELLRRVQMGAGKCVFFHEKITSFDRIPGKEAFYDRKNAVAEARMVNGLERNVRQRRGNR